MEHRILLDLKDVQGVDAAGVGLLVELYCGARRRHAELRVIQSSSRVQRVLTLTNLEDVLGSPGSKNVDEMLDCGRRVMSA